MDIGFIRELAKILQENSIQKLEYTSNNEEIKLTKNIELESYEKKSYFNHQNDSTIIHEIKSELDFNKEDLKEEIVKEIDDKETLDSNEDKEKIKANMIGTFYRKPSPDEEEFVKVASKVKKGDVVGIIESMKLLNEIKAPFDCEIIRILAEDEEVVEFGQDLFEVKVI